MSETNTQWLRTPEGLVRLVVLRQFNFIYKVEHRGAGGIITTAGRHRKFEVREHFLNPADREDAEVLNHPWICEQFADGCIEPPEQTRARVQVEAQQEAERSAASQRRFEEVQREADRAFENTVRAVNSQAAAGADLQRELNTPINQLPGGTLAGMLA